MQPLITAYNAGGFYLDVLGEPRCFLPVMAFFVQDSKEGDALSGCYTAWNAQRPCRLCWTAFADMNNPRTESRNEYREQEDVKATMVPIVKALKVHLTVYNRV